MTRYFADSAASGANNGTSWTDAWTSLDTAMNTVAAGDEVLCSGTFNELVTIDTAGTTFADSGNIRFFGDDKTGGSGRGGRATVTIDGQSTRTNCMDSSLGSVAIYHIFQDFKFTGATGDGVSLGVQSFAVWIDCEFDNNGTDGIQASTSNHWFFRCQFHNNSVNGLGFSGNVWLFFCAIYDNTQHQYNAREVYAFFNVLYGLQNGYYGFQCTFNGLSYFLGNTIDGEGSTTTRGINKSHSAGECFLVANNIFHDLVTNVQMVQDMGAFSFIGYNMHSGETTKYSGWTGTVIGDDVDATANFEDEAGHDYTPASGDEALEAGVDGGVASVPAASHMDIGAIQRQPAAGGGGGGVRNPTGGPVG